MSRFYIYTMELMQKYEDSRLRRNVMTVEEFLPLLRFMSHLAGTVDTLSDENAKLDKRVFELEERLDNQNKITQDVDE